MNRCKFFGGAALCATAGLWAGSVGAAMGGAPSADTEAIRMPVPFCWNFDAPTLTNRTYLADLDYLKANTEADLVLVAPTAHVIPEGNRVFHDALKELVAHAHKLGIRVALRASTGTPDFFSPDPQGLIPEPENAQGMTYDAEATLDAQGTATFTEEARWARPKKIKPLRNDVIGAWVFEKTDSEKVEGFYRRGTLVDVTDRVKVVSRSADCQTVRVEAGREHAGKTAFLVTVQYFNCSDLFSGAMWRWHKRLMDELVDIPLDGFCMDEQGYILLAFTPNGGGVETTAVGNKYDAFRFRFYTSAMARHFREKLGLDLKRLLFDMRYAPEGEDAVRIRAINRFWREVQAQPTKVENQVADYQRKLWGTNAFLSCHATFHNSLHGDDAWRTGNGWWNLPRDYGFTDEYIEMPVRMGVLAATPSKPHFGYNMFYSKDPARIYWNMALCAPFNLREFHHSFNDGFWGLGYREQPFTANVRKFDRALRPLEAFQKDVFPKLDLLVVFGTAAQVNWYPDRHARNVWDVDGAMNVQKKSQALWDAGYRCALVPDTTIEDGRLVLKDGKYVLNGHPFSHAIFLYPKYATKKTYAFLNVAHAAKMPLAVVGRADIDFDAEKASFGGLRVADFSTELAAKIGCPKSAIPGGCVYDDGSFCLVSDAVVTGKPTPFDFTLNGVRHRGTHTGVYAWRNGKVVSATPISSCGCGTEVASPWKKGALSVSRSP